MTKGQRGFTLVELLIGMAVMALVMAAVFGVLSSSINAQMYGVSHERSFSDASRVMQAVTRELHYSTGQTIAAGGGDITYSRPDELTGVARSGRIQNLATGQVQITRGAVAEVLGSGTVQANFAYGAQPQQIQVTVTAQVPTGGSASQIVLRSVVWTGPVIRQ